MKRPVFVASLVAAALFLGMFVGEPAASGQQPLYRTQVLVDGLVNPWGLAFLPNGDALVTERDSGRILRVTPSGDVSQAQKIDEQGEGEGGLLGIAVSPDYDKDGLVYAYYSTAQDNRVVRFKLGETPRPVLTGIPRGRTHNGGRIAFGPGGALFIGTGEAGNKKLSQNRKSLGGKILRINPGGGIPKSNPFGNEVYSYGHRNVQGLAWDAAGRLYASELGQADFDEVNRIRAGKNYGWPIVEGKGNKPRFVNPLTTFKPDRASPSGLMVYRSKAIKPFQGDLLMAALGGQRVWKMELNGRGEITKKSFFLKDKYGRIRHVAQGPDNSIWLLTTNGSNDKIVRLIPN